MRIVKVAWPHGGLDDLNDPHGKWKGIMDANPILKEPGLKDRGILWSAFKDAAEDLGLVDKELVDFIANGMTGGREGRSLKQIILDRKNDIW